MAEAPPARDGTDQVRTSPAVVVEPADAVAVEGSSVKLAGRATGTATLVCAAEPAFETVTW